MAANKMIYRFSLDVYIHGLDDKQLLVVEGETFRREGKWLTETQKYDPVQWVVKQAKGVAGITIESEEGFWNRHPNRSWET